MCVCVPPPLHHGAMKPENVRCGSLLPALRALAPAGNETKFGNNKKSPPPKLTKADKIIDRFSAYIFILQLVLVIIFGIVGDVIRQKMRGDAGYLQFERKFGVEALVIPARFLLLNSTMIPISLKVGPGCTAVPLPVVSSTSTASLCSSCLVMTSWLMISFVVVVVVAVAVAVVPVASCCSLFPLPSSRHLLSVPFSVVPHALFSPHHPSRLRCACPTHLPPPLPQVTLDLCKLCYSKFINHDIQLYDEVSDTPAHSNSTALSEDLGQVRLVSCVCVCPALTLLTLWVGKGQSWDLSPPPPCPRHGDCGDCRPSCPF